LQAYAATIGDPTLLRAALARNVYGTVEDGNPALLDRMAQYVEASLTQLRATDDATITSGQYAWPDVAALLR